MWGEGEELPDKISQLVRDVRVFGEESCDVLIVEEEDGGGPTETAEPLVPVGEKGERDPPLLQVVGKLHKVVPALVLELWRNQAEQWRACPVPSLDKFKPQSRQKLAMPSQDPVLHGAHELGKQLVQPHIKLDPQYCAGHLV